MRSKIYYANSTRGCKQHGNDATAFRAFVKKKFAFFNRSVPLSLLLILLLECMRLHASVGLSVIYSFLSARMFQQKNPFTDARPGGSALASADC